MRSWYSESKRKVGNSIEIYGRKSCIAQYGYICLLEDESADLLGDLVLQIDEKGPRIDACGNKAFGMNERQYWPTEEEFLVFVWAVEPFNMFQFGMETELGTGHKYFDLIFGLGVKPRESIERQVLKPKAYKCKVKHSPKKKILGRT